jgi:hypothetical protein
VAYEATTLPAKGYLSEWAMLGSNRRPLPCEGSALLSLVFVVVQKYLQNSQFATMMLHSCSPLFMWVGVLLVYLVYRA